MFLKGRICEMFGWTFEQFDQQPADEVLQYISLKGVYEEIKEMRRKSSSREDY